MALEKAGNSFNVDKLVKKLEKLYPEYDFSKPPPLDRKCKVVESGKICNKKAVRPIYTDADGNERCGFMYKQVGDTPYAFVKRECHAVITTPEERVTYEQGDIF